MHIAFSPCPNDTAIFHSWMQQTQPTQTTIADVQTLNELAQAYKPDVVKISFFCYPHIAREYIILPVGAAIVYDTGPVAVSKATNKTNLEASQSTVALPGEHTTAHFLYRVFMPYPERRIHLPYDQILSAVQRGTADIGVIIHESRFLIQEYGLNLLVDLGSKWTAEYELPVPLGGIVAKRSLGEKKLRDITETLHRSAEAYRSDPSQSRDYIAHYAQELSPEIRQKHINAFVSDETYGISHEGEKALAKMFEKCAHYNLTPFVRGPFLFRP